MNRIPVVDRKECIGCGVCIDCAPGVFRFDADGKSEVFDPYGAPEEDIQRAVDRCPVECISWVGAAS
jgi:ferredoxin